MVTNYDLEVLQCERREQVNNQRLCLPQLPFLIVVLLFASACSSTEDKSTQPVQASATTHIPATSIQVVMPSDTPQTIITSTYTPSVENTVISPTSSPTPEITLTPVSFTDSGLIVYDDFNVGENLDPNRWWGDFDSYRIEDGVLIYEFDQPIEPPFSTDVIADVNLRAESHGEVRFSVETRIKVDSTIADYNQRAYVGLSLIHQDQNELFIGIEQYLGSLVYVCNSNAVNTPYDILEIIHPEYDEWLTIRMDIILRPGVDHVEIAGYFDGYRFALIDLPETWQHALQEGDELIFRIVHDWDDTYSHSKPFITYFDYIAFWPYEP